MSLNKTKSSGSADLISYDYNTDATGLSLVLKNDFNDWFIFGKLGMLSSEVEGTYYFIDNQSLEEKENHFSWGFGFGYNINKSVSLTMDYFGFEVGDNLSSASLLSTGIKFFF